MNIWWQAIRPKTLTAAAVPVSVGTALVVATGLTPKWGLSVMALLSALMIQIGTNLFNDVLDFKKGADTGERIGPRRATQSGLVSAAAVQWAAVLAFVFAAVFAIPLLIAGGWTILGIGVVSLFCGYAYTGGPYPLAYKGLGDLFVILFFGLVAVAGTYFLHSGEFSLLSGIAGLQVGFLATVLIAINNLRDASQDAAAGKMTLAVRWGERAAKLEIAVLVVAPFLLNVVWYRWFGWGAVLLPLFAVPMAISLLRKLFANPPGPLYNKFLAKAAALHLVFGILLSAGLVLR